MPVSGLDVAAMQEAFTALLQQIEAQVRDQQADYETVVRLLEQKLTRVEAERDALRRQVEEMFTAILEARPLPAVRITHEPSHENRPMETRRCGRCGRSFESPTGRQYRVCPDCLSTNRLRARRA